MAVAQVIPFFSRSKANHWLSNFDPCSLVLGNMEFSCVEQAYQWSKAFIMAPNDELRGRYVKEIMEALSGGDSKALARKFFQEEACCQDKLHSNWRKIRFSILSHFVYSKFVYNPDLRQRLLDTGDALLAESTTDLFWATGCRTERQVLQASPNFDGQNQMGKILMSLRSQLRDGRTTPHCLVVGDSLVSGLQNNTNYLVKSWPGGHINDVVRLAAVLVHSGIDTIVLFVGTNDLQAEPPWANDWRPKRDHDGALLRTVPRTVKARFLATLDIFFNMHPNTKVVLCELLPRLCDSPSVENTSGLSRIQKGVQEVNDLLATKILSHFGLLGRPIHLLSLYTDFLDASLFVKQEEGTPSLHLNRKGTQLLHSKILNCLN